MAVPFVNLEAQHRRLRGEILARLAEVFDSREYIQGRYVGEFEQAFGLAHGVAHVAGCSNGTSALALALRALGVGPGDEVITVAHTFIATAEAICDVGATPVFVDVDPLSQTMDPAALAAAVTARSRAVIPVHLFGIPCDMEAIMAVADRHGLAVVEDCAQAHLARYRGRPVGSFGAAGTFSFFPGKNLGACGDAGCVVSTDAALAARIRKLRDHGRSQKYEHDLVGRNERMDAMQAAVLSVKLPHLAAWTATRRENAARYARGLAPLGLAAPRPPDGSEPVWHLHPVQLDQRDAVARHLAAAGIGTGVHYPIPVHLQPAFLASGSGPGSLPASEGAASRVLSLPMCGELSAAQVEEVCEALGRAMEAGRGDSA